MEFLRPGMRVHLVGVGGTGLSAIARVLHGWGYPVSGSDRQATALTERLAGEGIAVSIGHRAENVAGAGLVVISSAIAADNEEVEEAERRGIPVLKRERFLADLTAGKTTIAVAGTHGKTTTSALIAWMLLQAGLDPTFISGGILLDLGTNARAGQGPHFVIEADEYDRAFLGLRPDVAVVTIVEHDHPDCYPTFASMQEAFAAFVAQIAPGGILIAGDDAEAGRLALARQAGGGRASTYGLGPGHDWQATDIRTGPAPDKGSRFEPSTSFEAWHAGRRLGRCVSGLPGLHNVLNALAALAAAFEAGVGFEQAAGALATFGGTGRRFEIKGEARGVTVVDDYAHHPTEVRATLAAARSRYPGRGLWAVYQPHTFSRTAALLDEFGRSFGEADHVIVTGIYAARERDTLGISGAAVADRIRASGHPDVRYCETLDEAAAAVLSGIEPGNVVLTLGAGDGYRVGEQVLAQLEAAG
jgi:UDP-N-acetylmuramate--alanine ligase